MNNFLLYRRRGRYSDRVEKMYCRWRYILIFQLGMQQTRKLTLIYDAPLPAPAAVTNGSWKSTHSVAATKVNEWNKTLIII